MRLALQTPIGFALRRTQDLIRWADEVLAGLVLFKDQVSALVAGNIGFGDGTNADNLKGQWTTIADSGTADVEFAVPHTLGVVPIGFLLLVPPASGFVYKGSTAWTTSNLYLKCSAANQALTIFVIPTSIQS